MGNKTNLRFFETIAEKRDFWKEKNSYYWQDIESLCAFLVSEEASVLEVGCGTGDLLARLNVKRKVGIDYSQNMISVARAKYPEIEFHVMEAEQIQLDEKFDYIVLSNLIGYVEDIQEVFIALQKVCYPQSKIIVTYYSFLWQPLLNIAERLHLRMSQPEQNWLSKQDINNLLDLSGFDPFKGGERQLIPVYIPLLSSLFNKYIARLPFFRKMCITHYTIARPFPAEATERSHQDYSVSVIIPAMNESGNIEEAVLRIPKMGRHTEIIFVEGRSEDDTWEKIQEMHTKHKNTHDIKIVRQDGRGKGDAVRKGFEMAQGDILMILDADLTVPPEDLPKFYDAIASGKGEFINGSRLVYNMDRNAMRFLNLLGNKFFSLMFTWLLDQRFKDTLCGTKVLFRRDYERLKRGRAFFGDFDPFGDFDLIFGASKLNLKIVEIPIRYRERRYGSTNISRFRHGLLLLRMCLFAARRIKFF
jgi:ubiquinone/menaquinone biosynthesis C-methylase UbiE